MSIGPEQGVALVLMFSIGLCGLTVFFESERKLWRIAGATWAALWWLPPFAVIWVKGVFG